jgi:hypothetical protein
VSLDISKLENVRAHGEKTTARCPACAEAGQDQTRNHLFIQADGRFGCVVYPGDSSDASAHRKRIFALCGDRELKPLAVHSAGLGRLGRVNQTALRVRPLKTGLLGHLGRVFQTHARGATHAKNNDQTAGKSARVCKKGVPGVPSGQTATPHRPLSEPERDLLTRWCGTDDDAIILEARTLFNATIVGMEPSEAWNASLIKASQTEFSW